jgi:DNA polymerase III subunit delta'
MQITWKTYGHESNKAILARQLETGKLPHAYLFVGPEGVGKKFLALEFAEKILQTQNLSAHPDFQILDQTEEISVEQIRDFTRRVSLRPFAGQYKVAVVNNAQMLNAQGSNALLKTLEDGSRSTIVMLISTTRPLATIVSRCQGFHFNAFTARQLKEFAELEGLKVADQAFQLSCGSISSLKALAGENISLSQNIVKELASLTGRTVSERFLEIPKFADMESAELEKIFSRWLYAEKSMLASDVKRKRVVAAIYSALNDLKTNKNKKLLLQGLFLKM